MFRLNQIIKSINCLKNKNLLKSRFILSLLFLFSVNALLFGEDITWIGGAVDNNWDNANNWSPNTAFPTSADKAIIDTRTSAVKINLSSDVTVGSLATYGDNACTINMGSNDIDIIDDLIVGSTWNLVTPNANYSGNLVLEASSSATINCSLLHLTTYSNTPEKINIGANVSINATKVDLGDSTTGRASGVEFSGDGSITAGEVAVVGPKTVDDMISTTAGSTVNVSVPGLTNKTWTGATSSAWTTDSNWSPNGVPTSTDDVSIPSGITYSPIISSTVSIDNLEIATGASLEINGGSLSITNTLTASGGITGSGSLSVGGNTAVGSAGSITLGENFVESGDIILGGNISAGGTLTLGTSSTNTVTGTGSITSTGTFTNNANLTSSGAITSDGILTNNGTLNGSGTITANSDLVNAGTLSQSGNITVGGNFTNNTSCSVSGSGNINVQGNFSDSGTWAGKTITLSGNTTSSFSGTNTYSTINVTNGTKSFTSALTATTLAISGTTTSVTLSGASTLNTLTDTSGDLTFAADTTVKSATTLATSGTVTINSGKTLTINNGTNQNFTHTTGKTVVMGILNASDSTFDEFELTGTMNAANVTTGKTTINGTVNAVTTTLGDISKSVTVDGTIATSGNQLYKGSTTFKTTASSTSGNITFNKDVTLSGISTFTANDATNGAITFNSTVSSAFDATFTSTKLTFVDDVTASTSTFTVVNTSTSSFNDFNINKLDFTGTSATATATFNATGIVTENLVIPCKVELNNSSSTTSTDGSIQFAKAVTVNGNSTVVSADVTPTNSDKGILFGVDAAVTVGANTLALNGSTLLKSGFTGTGTGTVNITGNLIINRGSTATVTIACTTNVSKNIVLYTGALSVSKDLTSTLDIVLLGANYSDKDPQTSVAGAYKYANPRPSQYQYSETNLPAGQRDVPPTYSGTVTLSATMKSSKNFYANGIINFSGTGGTLALPSNKNNATSFSEVYNSTFTGVTVSGTDVSIATEDSTVPTNTSWDTSYFEIASVESVRDDVIKVTFNRAVRNPTANTFNLNQTYDRMTKNAGSYGKFYTDIGCTTELSAGSAVTEVYIKSPNTWNTDATGTSAGSGTDASGNNKKVIPYLSVPRDTTTYSFFITDLYGKRLQHYAAASGTYAKWTSTTDKAGPVLISVKTGQETHDVYVSGTGESSQHSYDSHNFIEFNYSEAVNFGDFTIAGDVYIPSTTTFPYENVQVTSNFGSLSTDITSDGTMNLIGLAQIASGKMYTGKNGSADKYANALYSSSSSSIKLSVAGYTNGTITGTDGNNYKNWESYIESAVTPSGTVVLPNGAATNNLVKDSSLANNSQVANYKITINVDSTESGTYGDWDVIEPVFAPLKMNSPMTGIEAVGGGDGSVLNKIEFHILDNPSSTDDSCYWFTEKGWCKNPVGSASLYLPGVSYSADIFGGSRPFSDTTNRTTGGIRYSTIINQQSAFLYCVGTNGEPSRPFTKIEYGADASLFTGFSSHRRAIPITPDSLFFSLDLTDTNIHYNQSFTVSYNSSSSYITDLAGNRLRSEKNNSIDRTPPSFNISLSPVSENNIYVTFAKRLRRSDIIYNGHSIPESFETIIPYCFELGTIDTAGKFTPNADPNLIINKNVPCEIVTNKNENYFTTVKLTLNRNITLSDVKTLYIRLKNAGTVGGNIYDEKSIDPVTGLHDCYVTFIQDILGNYMQYYAAHALSDFAINVAFPEYAYDAEMTVNGESLMDGLYQRGSWAVHNWNEEQYNYGTLPYGDPIDLVSTISDGNTVFSDANPYLRLYLSNSPTENSVSNRVNSYLNESWRIWLPNEGINGTINTFTTFSESNNLNYKYTDSIFMNSTDSSSGLRFSVNQSIVDTWKSGDQISFMFGLQTSTGEAVPIVHSPYLDVTTLTYNMASTLSLQYPLYCLRLKDSSDIFSLDLWSFKVKSVINQRGGVTILNNVINPLYGEKCVVKISTLIPSKVNVIVMTLDGNVVTYLNRTYLGQGDHYFTWNGTNNSGNFVARGMYFIRVIGSGYDETRKVMVVK